MIHDTFKFLEKQQEREVSIEVIMSLDKAVNEKDDPVPWNDGKTSVCALEESCVSHSLGAEDPEKWRASW